MPVSIRKAFIFMITCALLSCAWGQTDTDEAYKAKRQKAFELFNQNREPEALPLFEELAAGSPNDSNVLLGLAGCLVNHSAGVAQTDEGAAAKEVLRAKALLLKAKELGNKSLLIDNLLQTIPPDGKMKYSSPAMQAGEIAFTKRDFDEAIRNYQQALKEDPKNYSAALFTGDAYYGKNDFVKAGEWYGRASQIDPNRETAYRYYADMLMKNGDMEKARKLEIQAVIAEPYNPISWRGLQAWANVNHLQLTPVHINVPRSVTQKDEKNIEINIDPKQPKEISSIWLSYSLSKALWRGDKFKQEFPGEKQYRHSLAEEADCLSTAAVVFLESNSKDKNKKSSSLPKDPDLATLLKLKQAEMIEPYVLLNAADEGIAQDYGAYREKNRSKLEQYLSEFVVPPAPAK